MTPSRALLALPLATAALATLAPVAAAASRPNPVRVAADARSTGTPNVVVDAAGATGVAWETTGTTANRIRFALRPRGRAFRPAVTLPLPPGILSVSQPHLYLVGREWRIVLTGQANGGVGSAWVARSTNGSSWSLTRIPDAGAQPVAFYSAVAADASGIYGLVGSNGSEELVRVAPGLGSATRTPFLTSFLGNPRLVVAGNGTVIAFGVSNGQIGFQTAQRTGSIPLPACPAGPDVQLTGAGSATGAVVIVAACGVAYATTFDASGATTPLRRLGPARPFTLPVGVAGAARRHVAAWIAPDGDIRLARTANDRTWSVAAGQIPASRLDPGSTFPGGVAANGTVAYLVDPPGNPPRAVWAAVDGSRAGLAKIVTRGLARPKVGRIGTAAVAVSRSATFASVRRTGKIAVRIAASVGESLTVYVTSSRRADAAQLFLGTYVKPVKAGVTRRLVLAVDPSQLASFGTRRGDAITVEITGRNGRVSVSQKLT